MQLFDNLESSFLTSETWLLTLMLRDIDTPQSRFATMWLFKALELLGLDRIHLPISPGDGGLVAVSLLPIPFVLERVLLAVLLLYYDCVATDSNSNC